MSNSHAQCNIQKLHQEDISKTSWCAASKEIEAIIKTLPTKKTLSRYWKDSSQNFTKP